MAVVSVPYSSGLSLQERLTRATALASCAVSVPYSSGLSLQDGRTDADGAGVIEFQSPIHRGCHCRDAGALEAGQPDKFQSPIHRGCHCRGHLERHEETGRVVSVPYSSGLSLQG